MVIRLSYMSIIVFCFQFYLQHLYVLQIQLQTSILKGITI